MAPSSSHPPPVRAPSLAASSSVVAAVLGPSAPLQAREASLSQACTSSVTYRSRLSTCATPVGTMACGQPAESRWREATPALSTNTKHWLSGAISSSQPHTKAACTSARPTSHTSAWRVRRHRVTPMRARSHLARSHLARSHLARSHLARSASHLEREIAARPISAAARPISAAPRPISAAARRGVPPPPSSSLAKHSSSRSFLPGEG